MDEYGHAILSDFGLSIDVPEPSVDTSGGSLRWRAPELLFDAADDDSDWLASAPNVASDVWSFGCTAYEVGLCIET